MREILLKLFKPILKYLSSKRMPYSKKLVTGVDYYRVRDFIKPGDILITQTEGELTNSLIPGFWSHSAVYAGYKAILKNSKERIPAVIEATTKGLVYTDLVSFLLQKDHFCVLRPKHLIHNENMVGFLETKLGSPYDWEFKFTSAKNEAYYCFEATAVSYNNSLEDKSKILKGDIKFGLTTFTANDFLASQYFELIYYNLYSELHVLGYGRKKEIERLRELREKNLY